MINPGYTQTGQNDTKYTITHQNPILEENVLFDTHINLNAEFRYTAIDKTHRHWIPEFQNDNIFMQVAMNMLYSNDCVEESINGL